MSGLQKQVKYNEGDFNELKEEYQDFVYIVSHDLNAVFRATLGFSQIIRQEHGDTFDEQTKTYFNYISNSAQQGKEILESLRDFSRLNTRANPFFTVDCNDILSQSQDLLTDLIHAKGAVIETENLPVIEGDQQQLILVFFHLLQNALIYQKEGNPPRIDIDVQDKGEEWLFRITDNGIGISKAFRENLFKVFRRGVGDDYPGLGMGLAIVKKVIHRHGGSIWVEPVKKGGTAFYFTTPKTDKTL